MNIFEQYGIKEVADVTLYSINLDENDNEIYIPVLYLDTLKVSNVEETTQQTSAQGGIGNPKLITWDYGKDITITLTDALFSPASMSMNWGGTLNIKGLVLHLQHYYDKNTDGDTPNSCFRNGKLHIDQTIDFMIIPEKWHYKLFTDNNKKWKEPEKESSAKFVYCWLINGYLISDNDEKKNYVKNLLLFYRQSSQEWYFFNGASSYLAPPYLIPQDITQQQCSKEKFLEIKDFFCGGPKERLDNDGLTTSHVYNTYILTQNLYLTDSNDENTTFLSLDQYFFPTAGYYANSLEYYSERLKNYSIPYRYFANIGVENNSKINPFEFSSSLKTNYNAATLIENMEKYQAKQDFCINVDINLLHSNYRFLNKYAGTELTVYIDPRTMQPYQANTDTYISKTGETIVGNLRQIHAGETYYRWVRKKASQNNALGNQLVIDAEHYPGTFKLIGKTHKRDRIGTDHAYQFEIPLCKLHPENKLILSAEGEPTVFTMKMNVLRRYDGVMMKLTEFDTVNQEYNGELSQSQEITEFNSPNSKIPATAWITDGVYSRIDLDPMMGMEIDMRK